MECFKVILNSFYKNLDVNFNEIDLKKLLELKSNAKHFNKYFKSDFDSKNIVERYTKIMEMIHTSYNGNKNDINPLINCRVTNTGAEKLLLYMLSIDPELEALIIYKSYNTLKEIKEQIILKFGVYDPNLVKIESQFIKRFLSTNKKMN